MNMSFLEAAADKMMTDFKTASGINHNGIKGTIREQSVVESLLRKYLPKKYDIGAGIVVNSEGGQSKQQDIVIFDAFTCPLLYNEENVKVFPVECVYATIEVKSTLTKEELEKSLKNVESVRELVSAGLKGPTGYVFAYQSSLKIETMTNHLISLNAEIEMKNRASITCILDQGMIAHFNKNGLNQIISNPNEDTMIGEMHGDHKKTLIIFYLALLESLNGKIIVAPNMQEYAKKQGYLTEESYFIPSTQFCPEGTYYLLPDGRKLFVKEVFDAKNKKN